MKKLQFKNQKLLRNNHEKISVGCKIFISSIKEEGLHHLSRELPNSTQQNGSHQSHFFFGGGEEGGAIKWPYSQTATTETGCSERVAFCTPSETNVKGKNKANPQLLHILR